MTFYNGTNDDENAAGGFEALPDGEYLCSCTECEARDSRNSDCRYYATVFEVVQGQFCGRKIFANFVFEHQNEKAVNIGRARMKQLALAATGNPIVNNPDELYRRPVALKVRTRLDRNSGYENTDIQEIKPGGAGAPQAGGAPQTWQNAPAPGYGQQPMNYGQPIPAQAMPPEMRQHWNPAQAPAQQAAPPYQPPPPGHPAAQQTYTRPDGTVVTRQSFEGQPQQQQQPRQGQPGQKGLDEIPF